MGNRIVFVKQLKYQVLWLRYKNLQADIDDITHISTSID